MNENTETDETATPAAKPPVTPWYFDPDDEVTETIPDARDTMNEMWERDVAAGVPPNQRRTRDLGTRQSAGRAVVVVR